MTLRELIPGITSVEWMYPDYAIEHAMEDIQSNVQVADARNYHSQIIHLML